MIHLTRTKSFLWLFSLLLTPVLFIGCQSENSEAPEEKVVRITEEMLVKKYDYLEDLKVYLNENVDADMTLNPIDTLLLVPMNSCASCVSYTFNALSINPFSGKIILGGNPDDYPQYTTYIDAFAETNPDYYIDSTCTMFDYRIGVSGPTMLLKSADEWKIIELSIADWPIIVQFLHWNAPDLKDVKH